MSKYLERIRSIVPRAQKALRHIFRCLGQGNVRYHANETWGGNWADECVRDANESALDLNWIDPDQIAGEIEKAREEGQIQGLKMAFKIANSFSTKKDRSLHPDIPWEQMNESAQMAAHSASQSIAMDIYFIIHPDGGRFGKSDPEEKNNKE